MFFFAVHHTGFYRFHPQVPGFCTVSLDERHCFFGSPHRCLIRHTERGVPTSCCQVSWEVPQLHDCVFQEYQADGRDHCGRCRGNFFHLRSKKWLVFSRYFFGEHPCVFFATTAGPTDVGWCWPSQRSSPVQNASHRLGRTQRFSWPSRTART